jgi:uncharacterized protein YaaW (UPF0174 family)
MGYRKDLDLEFLRFCTNEDLDLLVRILAYDKDGTTRWTETLTESTEYKTHAPNHVVYWNRIGEELQRFGANTFVTMLRGGEGVPYREVLEDVCAKMSVPLENSATTPAIENALVLKTVSKVLETLSPEELRKLAEEFGVHTTGLAGPALIAAIQAAVRMGGFASFQMAAIVANAIAKFILGRGLTFAGNAAIQRAIGIATGPIGVAVTAAWTALEIAGPAYRVTIPAVFVVAYLRAKHTAGA